MEISIVGIGSAFIQVNEYFSMPLLQRFTNDMGTLKIVLDKASHPPYTPVPADYDTILSAVQNLADLAKNGIVDTTTPPTQTYLNSAMADSLNLVMQTLKVAGISAASSFNIPDSEKIQQVTIWQSLASYGVEQIMIDAVSLIVSLTQAVDPTTGQPVAIPTGRTLQGMLELEYVKNSNDLLFNKLSGLQSALKITNNIVNILNGFQRIFNLIQVSQRTPPFVMPTGVTVSLFRIAYSAAATAYFSQIFPGVTLEATTPLDLWASKIQLSNAYTQLLLANPSAGTASSLGSYLQNLIHDVSVAYSVFNTTPLTMQELYTTNPTLFNTMFKPGAAIWILDGAQFPPTSQYAAGEVQNHLQLATTTAQNLNSEQKDNVKSYLYIFQQFYESASNMLSRITAALEKMGRNASST
ncbi:MAG: hypothetical protein H0W88_04110 [Parachlamydiaceae bacterium]|nr:hypothetical protein [Parachlamydiaceae bacterium]